MLTRLEEVLVKEQRIHKLMDDEDLEGILLKKQANFSWLSAGGYNMVGVNSDAGVTALLVTKNARYIIASHIEMKRMLVEEGLGDLGFQPLEFAWYVDGEAEMVRRIVPDLSRVGADIEFANVRNMDGEIKKLRYSLTESEVERYCFLGTKLSIALEKVMLGIRPGDKECEIAGRFGAELWKDRIDPTGVLVAADERAALYRHPIPTQQMVRRYLVCSIHARYKGLITTVTRTMHFGAPTPKLSKQFANNLELDNRMTAATQVGKSITDAFETAVAAYAELGVPNEWKLHHQGGGMGYCTRDFKVVPQMTGLVQENQAFCWNPTLTGTKAEDGFVATAKGPILITHPVVFPKMEQIIDGIHFIRPGMLVID